MVCEASGPFPVRQVRPVRNEKPSLSLRVTLLVRRDLHRFYADVLFRGLRPDASLPQRLDDALAHAMHTHAQNPSVDESWDPFSEELWLALESIVHAILDHDDSSPEERAAMLRNLLGWAQAEPEEATPMAYHKAVAFLRARGDGPEEYLRALTLEDPFADPGECTENARAVFGSHRVPDVDKLRFLLGFPLAVQRIHAIKRVRAMRGVAEAFFEASLPAGVEAAARELVAWDPSDFGRSRALPAAAAELLAPQVDALEPEDGRLFAALRLYLLDLQPYREGLVRVEARRQGLGKLLAEAREPREVLALLDLAAETWAPAVEGAVAAAADHNVPMVRRRAVELLLARGSDPASWVARCLADGAREVREAPMRVAISRQKFAEMPEERRRALLAAVRAHERRFAFSPRQRGAYERLLRELRVAP